MKPGPIHPAEDKWNFERPDALVKWCAQNKLDIFGHTLVWHAQTNPWFFDGGDKQVITKRMKDHIETLVGRYKGKIKGWDVVNEAINDRGDAQTAMTENLRNSPWLKAMGPECRRTFNLCGCRFLERQGQPCRLIYGPLGVEFGRKIGPADQVNRGSKGRKTLGKILSKHKPA